MLLWLVKGSFGRHDWSFLGWGGNYFGCGSLRVRSRVTRVSEFLGDSPSTGRDATGVTDRGETAARIDLPVVG
jgi:hypothetical protein